MKAFLTLLSLALVACSQAPTTTYDRALERTLERTQATQIERIDANRYIATSSSTSLEDAKSQALHGAYETCMRQNLVTQILAQGRIAGDHGFVYASQFACVSGLTPGEEAILEKYPK